MGDWLLVIRHQPHGNAETSQFPNHQTRITVSMASIGVIDYGMGNLHSLGKALERVYESGRVAISYDPDELLKCARMMLQGVRDLRECMKELLRPDVKALGFQSAPQKTNSAHRHD